MPTYTIPPMPTVIRKAIDSSDLIGEDISLRGGDFTISAAGDWATLTKGDAARQSVEREALASPGEMPRRPAWGMGLRDNLMRAGSRDQRDRQQARVTNRLAANPRIESVQKIDVANRTDVAAGGVTVVTIEATSAGEQLRIQQTITPRGTR